MNLKSISDSIQDQVANAASAMAEKNREAWRNAPGAKKNMARKSAHLDEPDNWHEAASLPASLRKKFITKPGDLTKSKRDYADRVTKNMRESFSKGGYLEQGINVPAGYAYNDQVAIFLKRAYTIDGNPGLSSTEVGTGLNLSEESSAMLRSEKSEDYSARVDKTLDGMFEDMRSGSFDICKATKGLVVRYEDIANLHVDGDFLMENTDFIIDHYKKYRNAIMFCMYTSLKGNLGVEEGKKAIKLLMRKYAMVHKEFEPRDFMVTNSSKEPDDPSYGEWRNLDTVFDIAQERVTTEGTQDARRKERQEKELSKIREADLKKMAIEAMKSGDTSWTYTHRYGFGWKGAEAKEVSPYYALGRYERGDFPELTVDPEKRIIHVNEYSLHDME